MYKVLKVDGSTIYLGGANKEIITVDKDSFNYENPKVGDAVQVFKNDESILVVKTESVQRQVSEIASPNEKAVLVESGRNAKTNRSTKPLYKKPWFIVMMVILVLGVIGSSVGGGKNSDSTWSDSKEAAQEGRGTKENPINPTKTFIIEDYDCTIKAKVAKKYVGNEALSYLEKIGEDPSSFDCGPEYKTVVLQFSVLVKQGTFYGDLIGGGMYEPNKKSEMDFICYDLSKNADKNAFGGDIKMEAGKSGKVYCIYGIPTEFDEWYEKVYANGDFIWFHYTLK